MSDGYEPIRSYQRLFRPERRLYAVEGRSLPVPGGVPLRWLGWAAGALVLSIALASGSPLMFATIAAAAALAGLPAGGRSAAVVAAGAAVAAAWLVGVALALLDWPLRLVVLPVAVATLATQATPDGRRAERFAASWLILRLAPTRRSLGRALPPADLPRRLGGGLWVAPDERSPILRRGRVKGPAIATFAEPVCLRRAGSRGKRLTARPSRGRAPRGSMVAERVAIAKGEVLEIRA